MTGHLGRMNATDLPMTGRQSRYEGALLTLTISKPSQGG